jgi:hypothetical protein
VTFTVREFGTSADWNGKQFVAMLYIDIDTKRDVVRSGVRYFIARDSDGAWWYVPYDSDYPEDLRGPYTCEQAVAIARLLS